MKIVQGDEVPQTPAGSHRVGSTMYRRVLDGTPGTPGNFSLVIAEAPGDRYSPRHRHNFEQFRYQIEGVADYSESGRMTPGILGYFPEGVHYGPQTQTTGDYVCSIVLQCGGASLSGYIARDEHKGAIAALKEFGEFSEGVYRRNPGLPGKRNLDGFQAIWEHINKRPLVYEKPRYERPIMMDPKNYAWVERAGAPGVDDKLLGMFTERRTAVSFLHLHAGATLTETGRRNIYIVLSGTGRVGNNPYRRFTIAFLEADTMQMMAETETEILHFTLPDLPATFPAFAETAPCELEVEASAD